MTRQARTIRRTWRWLTAAAVVGYGWGFRVGLVAGRADRALGRREAHR